MTTEGTIVLQRIEEALNARVYSAIQSALKDESDE
jgi:hypothetical protein